MAKDVKCSNHHSLGNFHNKFLNSVVRLKIYHEKSLAARKTRMRFLHRYYSAKQMGTWLLIYNKDKTFNSLTTRVKLVFAAGNRKKWVPFKILNNLRSCISTQKE